MKQTLLIVALFILAICFFHSSIFEQMNETRNNDYYIPKKKWSGLETTDYSALFVKEQIQSMMTGTPDPEPKPAEGDVLLADASVISCMAEKNIVSLQEKTKLAITLTHTQAEGKSIPIYKTPNLERWSGTEWERLIYVNQQISIGDYDPVLMLSPGETVSVPLVFEYSATKLIPGKYRAVIYVGYKSQNAPYEKLYAEFELTE